MGSGREQPWATRNSPLALHDTPSPAELAWGVGCVGAGPGVLGVECAAPPSVPRLSLQAGPAGLPAADRPLLPPAQHLQQSQGRGAESRWGARRLWGKWYP